MGDTVEGTDHLLKMSTDMIHDMNLAHNVFIAALLWEEGVLLGVYCACIVYFLCFVVYSAVNVDKVRECHRYIIYIRIVFSNNCSTIVMIVQFSRCCCFVNWKYSV